MRRHGQPKPLLQPPLWRMAACPDCLFVHFFHELVFQHEHVDAASQFRCQEYRINRKGGFYTMVTLIAGTKAPSFSLKSLDGSSHSLHDTCKQHDVLVGFFKVSCPVCQLEFPYLERLHRSYPTVPIWGISQDDADATRAFGKMFGLTFPLLLDENLETTVSYSLTNVPSLFLVGPDLTIKKSIIGFDKLELENINVDLARQINQPPRPLFTAADEVPELKPG